jgi:tRNA-dihydrouridine synthase
VHGRTREQYYSGRADYEIIARVKQALSIPVIGNGDVTDGPSAQRLLEQTGCDGVMIGRGVRGNPWIFREISHYLETGEMPAAPSAEEICRMILRHAEMELDYKGEYTAVREMRKHIAWYTAGLPHSAALRRSVNEIESFSQLQEAVGKIFGQEARESVGDADGSLS